MKNRLILLTVALLTCLPVSVALHADDEVPPWMIGIDMPPYPRELSPTLPVSIFLENGEPIPATLTEDIPIAVVADSELFDPEPPAQYRGVDLLDARWSRKPAITWFFIDWVKNKNVPASTTHQMAINQMIITPVSPTDNGAITCQIGRKMVYTDAVTGKAKGTFANASVGRDVKVLDITPPTCGLEIEVEDGPSGTVWVAENPPDKYPLPKLADVHFSGSLIDENNPGEIVTISGLELGPNMTIAPEQASIKVSGDAVLRLKVNGDDNYRLNVDKLHFGICRIVGGEPAPVGPSNVSEINLSELELPDEAYLFVDASDTSNNRQVLYIPIQVK